ncbi:hypothetical protein DEJ05_11920, partial [Curtobacterium sp. MCLR17_045]
MRLTRAALILTTATLAVLLTGCSGADGADGGAATPTVTETVTAPPSDAASTPTPTSTCRSPVPVRRYRPLDRSAATGSPTLVWVHGGGFFRG